MKLRPIASRAAFVLLALLLVATTQAAELQPSHQCLPDETVFVLRVPAGRKFVDVFREQTKLGSVLLSPQRFEGVVNLIREQAGEGLTQFTESLGKYNLKIEDFPKLFDNEVGFAVIVEPRRGRYPLAVGLGWAEPDGDLGQRLMAALAQSIDDEKDVAGGARRVDFDIDGQTVIHITTPMKGPAELPSFNVDGEDLDEEKIKAKLEEQRKKAADAKQIDIDEVHTFVTRLGNRLLIGTTFPQNESEVREELGDDPDKKIDLSALTGLEEAKGIFARFLKAHSSAPAGLMPRIMATPGLAAALPDGTPLVDVLFMPEPLLRLAKDAESPTPARIIKMLGLDKLGPGAVRIALDRGAMRAGLFVSAPEPRQGLLALLDQPTFQPDPPAWVPANALSFDQLSFDLGKAYKLLREVLISEGGDQAQTMINQVEQQIGAFLQTDVETILSSVGTNHYFVSFPDAAVDVKAALEDEEAEAATSRMGIVWQLKDEALWKRLMQLAGGFAALSEGMIEPAEEQGYIGLRINVEDAFTGGLFVGHGHMVLGLGEDVIEPLLSTVRNPPEGAASFRGGDLPRRAAALLPPEPSIYYQVANFDGYLKSLRESLGSLFEYSVSSRTMGTPTSITVGGGGGGGQDDGEKVDVELMKKLQALLPSEQELEGATGVSVSQLVPNQHGVTLRTAIEMPAP
ncbi:MAG TPA: hypothetical protein VHD36_19105 [Pirellulales bacterium]|nr:hypothetical protein [Pirellulales bacterium]